jgi:5'-methylthioadenosine phosphorylase
VDIAADLSELMRNLARGSGMAGWTLGVIGGSGLYDIDGLEDRATLRLASPFGEPSGDLVTGRVGATRLVFLARHGAGHRLPPGDINARANIDVLKRAGCTDVLSLSAVGSLREDLPPETFVIVDQYIDRTARRPASFFGPGLAAHVSMADPVCPRLSALAATAGREAGARVVEGGTYLAMEGPQFSSRAESELYRSWGCAVVGMTNMPEARLAREAELPYGSVAMVTDYDCWRVGEAAVEVGDILAVLRANAARAADLVRRLAAALPAERTASPIDSCLDGAIITAPDARDPAMAAMLDAVAGRALLAVPWDS